MGTNPKIPRPQKFKKTFGIEIHNEQKQTATFKNAMLKRTMIKKGRV